ncbi:MAG: formylglycine-generating enzyme family protein [Anaerolineae bacterium]|nr:formylglycine-generating enzyme family protein [Anaerolineae bacterium]
MKRILFVVLMLFVAGLACSSQGEPGDDVTDAPAIPDMPDTSEPVTVEPPGEQAATELPTEPALTPTAEALTNAGWQPIVGELGGLPMVYVPAGCFLMGSTEEQIAAAMEACPELYSGAPFACDASGYQAEGPQREVCLDAFWIGQTEITNSQYAACVDAGACAPPADRTYFDNPEYADHPAVQIAWPDAVSYAAWIGGSLPTEAQWEYAARGPDGWVYPWGDTFEKDRLNYCDVNCDVYFWVDATYDDGYALTAPVGTYPNGASWVGALDVSGNAWEWVSSIFKDYPYDAADGREDSNAAGDHVLRGGAFDLSYLDVRSAFRYRLPSEGVCRGYGFRVAAAADAVAGP